MDRMDLKQLFRIIKKRFLTIILVSVCFFGLTLAGLTYFIKPTYEATEHVFVGSLKKTEDYYEENQRINRMVVSSIDFIASPIVLKSVEKELNLKDFDLKEQVTVKNTKESQIIRIHVRGHDPELVTKIARAITLTSVGEMKTLLKFEDIEVLSDKSSLNEVSNPLIGLAIGVIVGVFAGVGSAFGREALDDSVKDVRDAEKLLGISVLGKVDMGDIALPRTGANRISKAPKWKTEKGGEIGA